MTAEEFELLTQQSQPHEQFKKDWNTYYSLGYADTFLPNVQGYKGKALRLYDGGQFFKDLRKVERKVLAFRDNTDINTLISYTYPKGVLAEEKKNAIQVGKHEVCTFVEFDQLENVDITFKLGSDFQSFVNDLYQRKKINTSVTTLENTIYKTSIDAFSSHFKDGLVHDTMMRFILNTMNIPVDDVINVAPIYPKAVFDYITNYQVQDTYPVKIFFRKNQSQVLEDEDTLFPNSDEIYVWLVRDEEGIYDTDFVRIKLGAEVAQSFKKKELTENDINAIVKEAIGNAGILHIIEREEIDESVHEALGDALLVAVTLEDLNSNPIFKEVFKADPSAYLLLKAMDFAASSIKEWKLADRHWNPKVDNYAPLLSPDRVENAFFCGIINGIIDELAGVTDAVSFLIKLSKSKTEYENFKTAIRKLLEEENLVELLVKGALKNYINAENQEQVAYQFGHDLLQIVSFIIGIFQFAKSVASFASFIKRAIVYLKRFGRKGLDDLKKLNKKQIKEVFERQELFSKIKGKPIDVKLLKRLQKEFKEIGGDMRFDNESFAYCAAREKALKTEIEAITLGDDLIMLNKNVTTSAVYEELIHARQFRSGRFNEVASKHGNVIAENVMEKEAAEELIKNALKFKLPEDEVQIVKERLDFFNRILKDLGYEN